MHDKKERRGRTPSGTVEGTRKRSRMRQLLSDEKGTASIEAVIMLPFFIMVWGFLVFVMDVYRHKLDAGVRARDCGWSYAQTGCQTVPPSCTAEPADEIDVDGGESSSEITGALAGASEIPVIGGMLEGALQGIFGEIRIARNDQEVQRPQVLGASTMQTSATFAIMCNERPRTVGEMALGIVCDLVPVFC
ncbi:MAG: hypothetical protein M3Y87_01330 [Myxococcota bacterium]|nr:hypothetical protein [Myxococcota bacterium]